MMLAPFFLAFLIYASMLWTPCSPYYVYNTQLRQQGKLQWLSRELLIDAEMKVKAVQRYRDQYYKSLQYQLGDIMYELRDLYKRMVRIYQGVDKNVSYEYLDEHENIRSLVRVHRISMALENKVTMIQTWQRKRENMRQFHERMQAAMRSGTNQEYDELENVPLREVQVRERMARGASAGAPLLRAPFHRAPPRAPALYPGDKRKNKKWRHDRDDDFVRRSI